MSPGAVGPAVGLASYSQYLDPNRKWYNNHRLIRLHAWVVLLVITSSINGFDGSLLNSFQSMPQWREYFNHPTGGLLGVLSAIQNIGSLAGYPFAPYLSDGIGRRWTVWIGATILLGVAIQSAAYNIQMFIGARFCIGFGLTFATNSAPMLVSEISYPPYRAPLTSVYNSLWYSGNVIASWTSFGTEYIGNEWSWRIPSLMQALPSLAQFIFIPFAPESPRWLIAKGKEQEGLKILAYYHADGNEDDPLVQYEFNEIKAAIEFDHEVVRNVSWRTLFATPGNRKRVLVSCAIGFFSQWSGNGLVSYYLNKVFNTIGITSTTIQLLITGILAIWNLAWAIGISFYVDRLGRRFLFLTACGGCFIFFTMQTICSAQYAEHQNPVAAHAVIASIFLYYAAYDLAFTPLIITYTLEIMPHHIRAKGLNVFSFTVSVALIFNQYVNPIALDAIGWKYYIVYVCWLAFEFAFLWYFLIETKNKTPEETAALFDGEDVLAHIAAVAEGVEVCEDNRDFDEKASEKTGP
ncbi:general substrate transporter [Amylocystis lapponica]|nr:general substrate transporter [Amylocystis lapponica]